MESRTPPQNLDAEQSVLGSILLDNEVYAALEGTLRPEHFYKESHRKLFKAIERLFHRGEPMDLVTLTEELRGSGELDEVGNVPYLIGLADSVPTAAYAESYARIVVEKAVLRELIGASGQIMQKAYDQAMPLEQVLDAAERSIFELSSSKRNHAFGSMGELVTETFAYINELFANPDPVSGLRMGFKELDQMTAGLQASSLNVLAARPSMGKTALALSIVMNAALREGKTVGMFSLEMSGVQLVTRMLCSEARVDMTRVRNGQLTDRDFQRLADTAGRMSEAKIFIDDNADMTVMELRSRARRLMAEHDLGLIVIDYLQLMSGNSSARFGSENRQQEISSISRGLKALARELDVPVLVLSQLSRAVESRPNKRPMLSDLRECVPGDTLVVLADGRRVPIRELVGTTPRVTAVDGNGRLLPAPADAVWSVGVRPVFEVTTASGHRVRATAQHRMLARQGWTELRHLLPGDGLGLAGEGDGSARRAPAPSARQRRVDTSTPAADAPAPARAGVAIAERPSFVDAGWGDLVWDEITSIEPAGEEEVFDLTVPGPASWLADGLVCHNSGAIEQDADLVMFIYRDEYYDPNSEKQGIAEIIIGKQRNGPVGGVDLQFHDAHVRFNDLARSAT